jgi:hypothetical protein
VARREDDDLALLGGDCLGSRLGPRPLLDQQEVAARVIDAPPAQEARELQGKDDVAVDVLVQAVVAAALVAQQERRGLGLASPPADREQLVERRRVHERGLGERGLPPVRNRGERRIGMAAQRLDQGRQGPGEVSVLADTEPVARHVDRVAKPPVVSVEADQLGALGRAEHGRCFRVAPLPERALDLAPVQPGKP